jgi:hypothetical protein
MTYIKALLTYLLTYLLELIDPSRKTLLSPMELEHKKYVADLRGRFLNRYHLQMKKDLPGFYNSVLELMQWPKFDFACMCLHAGIYGHSLSRYFQSIEQSSSWLVRIIFTHVIIISAAAAACMLLMHATE